MKSFLKHYGGIYCIISISLLINCTVQLTAGVKNKIVESAVNLSDVQFYNSERIVLRRSFRKKENIKETAGKIKFKKGKYVETLIIRKKTPGVCKEYDDEKLFIQSPHQMTLTSIYHRLFTDWTNFSR